MKTKKNKSNNFTIYGFLVLGLSATFLLLLFTSPLFQISTIEVHGFEKYTQENILSRIHLEKNMHFFAFRPQKAKKILEQDPYIKSVEMNIRFPKSVEISIVERMERGYVPYMGAYLYIDEDGRVLQTASFFTKKLPVVQGLEFDRFHIGQVLEVRNEQSFDVVLKTAHMMMKYELLDDIIKIDVSDPKDIRIFIRSIDIQLGDLTDYDEKFRTMIEILDKIPEEDRGFLDIRDMRRPPVFKYLT